MYYVYKLLDYKKKVFYVGITKNLDVRIEEHIRCKNSFPQKTYRVRRCIKEHGTLLFEFETFETLDLARSSERELIRYYHRQLVNKQYGNIKSSKGRVRKIGRSVKCKSCGLWFRKINKHICKEKSIKESV